MSAKVDSRGAVAGPVAKCALALGAIALAVLAMPAVLAQEQAQEQGDAWVKLCHPLSEDDERSVCLIHHERIDGNSGMVVVSAAIRQVQGFEKEHILVTVPLGSVLPGGAHLRIDQADPVRLEFTFCHIGGCMAEGSATTDFIDGLKKGAKLGIMAVNAANQRPTVFEIPLRGFTKAYQGPPVDAEAYLQDREQLMSVIRERQMELARRAAENAGAQEGEQRPQ